MITRNKRRRSVWWTRTNRWWSVLWTTTARGRWFIFRPATRPAATSDCLQIRYVANNNCRVVFSLVLEVIQISVVEDSSTRNKVEVVEEVCLVLLEEVINSKVQVVGCFLILELLKEVVSLPTLVEIRVIEAVHVLFDN